MRLLLAAGMVAAAAALAPPNAEAEAATAGGGLTVTTVARQIALSNPLHVQVTQRVQLAFEGTPPTEAELWFAPESEGGSVGKATCTVNGSAATKVRRPQPGANANASASASDPVRVVVSLPASVSSGVVVECVVARSGAAARRPFPAKATQLMRHRFLFDGETVRAKSPYPVTGEDSTTVALPKGKLESHEAEPKPVAVSGRTITYGPYRGAPATPADAAKRIRVHYEHNEVHVVASSVVREIEVSLWGNVNVEEHVDVRHVGPTLEGHFSRLDHSSREPAAMLDSMRAHLPAGAAQLYYRDALGNVSTSSVYRTGDATFLDLKFRFPVYGGWHNEWYHGYNLPLGTYLKRSTSKSDRYSFEYDLGLPFKDLVSERHLVRVVLPPGASNVKVERPTTNAFPDMKVSVSTRATWLDAPWLPRTLVRIELHNYVSDMDRTSLRVTFDSPASHSLHKPLAVGLVVFALYVVALVAGRLSTASGSAGAGASKKKTKTL